MAEPLSLQHIARLICVQNLLDLTNGKDVTEYLKLAYHSAVTEDLLNHMVQFYPKKLTDEILAGLASPHIQNLRLVNCTRIKPSKFIKIVPYCKKLHGLDLKKCSQMMLPDFFVLIKMAGFHLTSLSVEDCTTVDDSVVHSILKNLPELRHLNVSSCNNITDGAFLLDKDQHRRRKHTTIRETEVYPCSLTSIDVSGCRCLTNLAIHNLASLTGPTLQHVCLSWTKLTLECLLCLAGLEVPRSFLGGDDEISDTVETAGINSENNENITENQNNENITSLAEDGSHSQAEATVLLSNGSERTSPAQELTDLCMEQGCQETVSSEAICDIPTQDGNVIQNSCYNDSSEDVQQVHEDGNSFLSGCVENSESQTSPAKESMENKCSYSVHQIDGPSNCSSEMHLSEAEDLHLPANCDSNALPLTLSETTSSNMSEGCNTCSVLKSDSSNACSVEQIDIVLNEKLQSLDLCNINETLNNNDKVIVSKIPRTLDEQQLPELITKDHSVCVGYTTKSNNVQNSEHKVTHSGPGIEAESLDEGHLNPNQKAILNLVQSSLDNATTSQSILSERNVKTDVDNVENRIIEENLLLQSPQLDHFVDSQPSPECEEELLLPSKDAVCVGNLEKSVGLSQPLENAVDASNQLEEFSVYTDVVLNELSRNFIKDLKSKHRHLKSEEECLPHMKSVYKPIIRSIDLEEIVHPNNKQKVLENALDIFLTKNPCLQTFKLSWPKLPNYLLKRLVDTCVDLRELTLVGCHVIDAEHIRYIGSQCRTLTKLELDDVRRLTDWSVVPAVSNTDIETLSLKETDIHDVTAIRMAAKLAENLKSLDISYCQELTERGINSLLRKKSCVTSFSVRQGALSDLSLGLLCDNFRQLRSLNIASVKSITGNGLISLAKSLRHLDFIDLSWASGSSLQDDVIEAFLTHCPRLNRMELSGQSLLTSGPFLPIISDYQRWSKCKALFFLKTKERELGSKISADEETDSSDDEYEAVCFPHRSTTFATNLQHLSLEYCDSITDSDTEDIVTVCRGSLTVIDYYSWAVKPRLLRLNKYKIKGRNKLDAEVDTP
uniref:F-box/LRR-repeat protein 2 n=1 Tax=Magallana gigas TaxID=29159 RepID=A0A8W8P275_MAGGI